MRTAGKCAECGAGLDGNNVRGFCPQCLIRQGLEDNTPTLTGDGPVQKAEPIEPASALGTVRYFGDYELLEEIARGGMGIVYKARQTSLNRVVALKMILSGEFAGGAEIKRFQIEAEAVAQLDHPNIVPIYEIGEHLGRHYFSMKLVEGGSLALRREKFLGDQKGVARLMSRVARAVHYAHQRGILHRDLKPGNILLDGRGEPHVTDFGLAKRVNSGQEMTISGTAMGTPHYMAPEQAAGKTKHLSTAADIYSLGAILYLLLTGKPPFESDSPLEVMRMAVEQEPEPPSSLRKTLDSDLETICLKCLEKSENARYGSAETLADDLDRWLRHEPIVARPSTGWERGIKWVRRKPVVAALSASVVVVLLIAMAGIFWQWRQADIARKNAEARALSETQAKVAANEQRHRAEEALVQIELQRVEELLRQDNAREALPRLARLVRENPSNRVATARLISALTQRTFALPIAKPRDEIFSQFAKFSPDGLRLAGISSENTVRVWDWQTGQWIGSPLRHDGNVNSVEFSPDGQFIATASDDKSARVWNARRGRLIGKPMAHKEAVERAFFSRTGQQVVTVSADGSARVWDAATGDALIDPLEHGGRLTAVELSADGGRLLTASVDGAARVWAIPSGKLVLETPKEGPGLRSASFSPDETKVLTVRESTSSVAVWDAVSGRLIWKEFTRYITDVYAIDATFTPDGTRIIMNISDDTVRMADAETGEPVLDPLRHHEQVESVTSSGDGLYLLTSARDQTGRIWDAESAKPASEMFFNQGIASLDPSGQRVATMSIHGVLVRDTLPGAALPDKLRHGLAKLNAEGARFSRDGKYVLISSPFRAQMWLADSGHRSITNIQSPGLFRSAVLSPDGGMIAIGSSDRTVCLWDARTGETVGEALPHASTVNAVRFSPDGGKLASACADGTVWVWDVRLRRVLFETRKKAWPLSFLEFSPDGQVIVSGDERGGTSAWSAQTGEWFSDGPAHKSFLTSIRFSPDSQRIVTASQDGTARIWAARTGQEFGEPFRHSRGHIYWAEFSANGKLVATAGQDQSAHIWDAQTGKLLARMQHAGRVLMARFSPDGRRIATASEDKTARLWDAGTGYPLSEPLRHESAVVSIEFSPDGRRLIAVDEGSGNARIWEVLDPPIPVPPWLPNLAEALSGQKLNQEGLLEFAEEDQLLEHKEKADENVSGDFYTRWRNWFFANRNTRAISPSASVTIPEYIHARMGDETSAGAEEAVRLSPTNVLALAQLAEHCLRYDRQVYPRKLRQAEVYIAHAAALAPQDAEIARLQRIIAETIARGINADGR